MRLTLIVATPDPKVQAFVGQQKKSLVPAGIAELFRTKLSVAVFAFQVASTITADDVTDYLADLKGSADSVIILTDNRCAALFAEFRDAFFIFSYPQRMEGKSMKNYFSMVLARLLRNFVVLSQRFDDAKFQKLLLLPLEIFKADELPEVRRLVHVGIFRREFPTELDKCLSELRNRQTPKTRTFGKKVYVKDDVERFFEYGPEKHARVHTGRPPHARSCDLNASFRFGRAYDRDRHFNVTGSGSERISGELDSCHGQQVVFKKRTHLNVFPNSYFE